MIKYEYRIGDKKCKHIFFSSDFIPKNWMKKSGKNLGIF